MRLLKRLTVISLLMLPCCYASAQSANGESIVISENATELGKVDLSEVNRISFTEAVANNVRVYARENLIYIEGAEQGRIEVYALNGTQCLAVAQWSGQPVDVSALPKGIYVLKVGNASFKFKK